jgi:hypothetical protein
MNVERIQLNNDRFRAANESIRERAEELGVDMEELPFLCECPVEDCVEILRLTRSEYAAIRDHDDRYMTAVGHEVREKPLGDVLSRNGRYVVVVKSLE